LFSHVFTTCRLEAERATFGIDMTRTAGPRRPAPMVSDLAGLPARHAFVVTAVQNSFQRLRVGAALLDATDDWHAIHTERSVTVFELAHGRGPERQAYNARSVACARREKHALCFEHAGFSDFFVPIVHRGAVEALLITGPFSTRRPTSAEVSERWRWLTGRHGHVSDPAFADYVAATLATLTLEDDQLGRYQRWLEVLALMLAERGDLRALGAEAAQLSAKLEATRFVERMWESAREMLDERTVGVWMSPQLGDDLRRLGAERLPDNVVVGLVARSESDPVDELLRVDAFRRACVDLALASRGGCGLVGDRGVMFLLTSAKSAARSRHDRMELAEEARSLAHRHGIAVHVGVGSDDPGSPLPARYEQALGAAERALSQGLSIAHAEPHVRPAATPLEKLRRDLRSWDGRHAETMIVTFEHYIAAVAVHCGHRAELSRPHLEVGFEQAAQRLLDSGAVAEQSCAETIKTLKRTERDASTFAELSAAYRRAVADLVEMLEHPVQAGQDRNLRRALYFIGEHLSEPLSLMRVSRVAGFSANYFSQLFKKRERMTFENYLRQIRIERSKELLASTDLSTQRVCQLSGFSSREYFHRVFRDLVGLTPIAYRSSRPVSRHSPASGGTPRRRSR
jgi:AraC-like DNA-binding protein